MPPRIRHAAPRRALRLPAPGEVRPSGPCRRYATTAGQKPSRTCHRLMCGIARNHRTDRRNSHGSPSAIKARSSHLPVIEIVPRSFSKVARQPTRSSAITGYVAVEPLRKSVLMRSKPAGLRVACRGWFGILLSIQESFWVNQMRLHTRKTGPAKTLTQLRRGR